MKNKKHIRLFLDKEIKQNSVVDISPEQAHYLKNVMRQKLSNLLKIFNDKDGEFEGKIFSLNKREGSIKVLKKTRDFCTEPDIWLIFAPIKHGKIDFLAQKATELGVSRLLPAFTERTVVSRVNKERLEKNAIEAAEQSERLSVPAVEEPQKLETILGNWKKDRKIILCDESGKGKPIKYVLSSANKKSKWAILIGPEGGFSPSELETLSKLSYVMPVSMGPRIMKADTAAIAALTCWQEHLGDWSNPPSFRE